MRSFSAKVLLSVIPLVVFLSFAAAQEGAPRPKGDTARGKAVFEENCLECHDTDTKEEKVGPGLLGLKLGKLPDGRKATHDQLLDIINTGPAEMPSFKESLTEQQKEDVVAFVLTL